MECDIQFQLVDSENVAKNMQSRMAELRIPFYRFSPHIDDVIPMGETDMVKLLNMILKVRWFACLVSNREAHAL